MKSEKKQEILDRLKKEIDEMNEMLDNNPKEKLAILERIKIHLEIDSDPFPLPDEASAMLEEEIKKFEKRIHC